MFVYMYIGCLRICTRTWLTRPYKKLVSWAVAQDVARLVALALHWKLVGAGEWHVKGRWRKCSGLTWVACGLGNVWAVPVVPVLACNSNCWAWQFVRKCNLHSGTRHTLRAVTLKLQIRRGTLRLAGTRWGQAIRDSSLLHPWLHLWILCAGFETQTAGFPAATCSLQEKHLTNLPACRAVFQLSPKAKGPESQTCCRTFLCLRPVYFVDH